MPTHLIVGAHFRPPAKAILQILPSGCPLYIVPEPTNEFDPNALKVEVMTSDLPTGIDADLTSLAAGFGFDAAMIRERERWHLGYIPRKGAEHIKLASKTLGALTFSSDGKPSVSWKD